MGVIKTEIRKLSKEAGGKRLARVKAHAWFENGKKMMNEKSVAATGKRFRPGKIYVFEYASPKWADKLEWWDKNPVVLALDPYNGNDVGINLNLLPVKVKEELLDYVYTIMQNQIKNQMKGRKSGDAIRQGQINLSYAGAKKFLGRFGFDFAIRQYIPNLKSGQAVISYENWSTIALCDFIDLNGSTVGKVRRQFRKHLGS